MNVFIYTFISIAVYLITFSVMWHVFSKREVEIETEYRLALSRACTAFMDAMTAVSKALDTEPESESEQTTLSEEQTND